MTPAKAKAFVARYGEQVAHAVNEIEQVLRATNPNRVLNGQVYSAETLARYRYRRSADDYRIMAAHVSDIKTGGTHSIAVVVEWDTEDVIIVDGATERRVIP